MLIQEVKIKHFGLLDYFETKFGEKLNVIEGSNESGKSTLAAFIRFMLYGFSNTPEGLEERRKRTSWTTHTAEGEMTVSVKGKLYRIDRYSAIMKEGGKEVYRDRTRVVDLAEGSLVTERNAGEFFLGVPEEVFVSSAFISQMDDTRVGEDKMREMISNLLFSGNEHISSDRAAKIIYDRLEEVNEEQSVAPKGLENRARELIGERERAIEINKTLLMREGELVTNRRERENVEKEIAKLEKLKSSFRAVALINNFDKLHNLERESFILNAEEAEFKMKNTGGNGFLPDASYRTELSVNRRVTSDAYQTYRTASESLEEKKSKIEGERENEKILHRIERHGGDRAVIGEFRSIRANRVKLLASAIVCGVLSAIVLLLSVGFHIPMLAAALALTVPGTVLFAILFFNRGKKEIAMAGEYGFDTPSEFWMFLSGIDGYRKAIEESTAAFRLAGEVVDQTKKTYLAAFSSLSATVAKWGKTLPETGIGPVISKLIEDIDGIIRDTEDFAKRKEKLNSEINAIKEKLAGENEEALRAALSPELRNMLCDMSFEQLLEAISSRNRIKAGLEKRRLDLEDEIAGLRQGTVNPVIIEEQIAVLRERVESSRQLRHALNLAYNAVSGAEENLRREITPRLTEYARRLMAAMTDGKYDGMDVDRDLFLGFTTKGNEQHSAECLSGGTRDLAYIALRLAYIDLLYSETPPLCFDESFAHQDNFRAGCTMRALRELAEDGVQSLIFTCRSRESTIAREVDRKYRHVYIEKIRAAQQEQLAEETEIVEKPVETVEVPGSNEPKEPLLIPGLDYPETREEHDRKLGIESGKETEEETSEENNIAESDSTLDGKKVDEGQVEEGTDTDLFDSFNIPEEEPEQVPTEETEETEHETEESITEDGITEDSITEEAEVSEETQEELRVESDKEPEDNLEEEPEEEPETVSDEVPTEEAEEEKPVEESVDESIEESAEESDDGIVPDETEPEEEQVPWDEEPEKENETEPVESEKDDSENGDADGGFDLFAPFEIPAEEEPDTKMENEESDENSAEEEKEEEDASLYADLIIGQGGAFESKAVDSGEDNSELEKEAEDTEPEEDGESEELSDLEDDDSDDDSEDDGIVDDTDDEEENDSQNEDADDKDQEDDEFDESDGNEEKEEVDEEASREAALEAIRAAREAEEEGRLFGFGKHDD